MAEIITARTGTAHVTPAQDASWHRGTFGLPTCVIDDPTLEGFSTEIRNNNEVWVRSGIAQNQGRFWWVPVNTYDSLQIENGAQGMNRIDRAVMRFTVDQENNTQSCSWVVIQGTPTAGTPTAPAYTQGDLDNDGLVSDMPMFLIELEGINLTSVLAEYEVALTTETARISQETIQMFEGAGYPITD